ncbi:MAG: nitrous oxide reductase accessory protein NosL [Kyrpidia tusciae]|nr:nitrous oxide reductase accessory protein NosL [Kyrpidia tusciae]MBE3552315.1 nitrous oxide reductase accessory protein NosL [Kyrpidia tusciae]
MKIKRMIGMLAATAALSLAVAGCGKQAAQPAAIDPAVDKCAVCHMTVKDDHFATEIILADGQALKFDDLGCMNKWTQQNGTSQVAQRFVRDYNSSQWLKFEDATYVYDPNIVTPMAYNVVSFQNKADAENFLKQYPGGKLFAADQLGSHNWARNMEMMKKMKEQMNMNSGSMSGGSMNGGNMSGAEMGH